MDDNQLRDFYPGEYERQHGGNVRVMPTVLTSIERAREQFFKKHRFDFISYTASRPTPDQALWSGFVLVKAKCESTGECALFLVDQFRYVLGLTAFGYVIDVDIDACVGLVR